MADDKSKREGDDSGRARALEEIQADEAKAQGNLAFKEKDYNKSISHYTRAIHLTPNNHLLYSNRSASYYSVSNFTAALHDAQTSVQLNPLFSKGFGRMGDANFRLTRFKDAISAYQKALLIDPQNQNFQSALQDSILENARMICFEEYLASAYECWQTLDYGSKKKLGAVIESMCRCLQTMCNPIALKPKFVALRKDVGFKFRYRPSKDYNLLQALKDELANSLSKKYSYHMDEAQQESFKDLIRNLENKAQVITQYLNSPWPDHLVTSPT